MKMTYHGSANKVFDHIKERAGKRWQAFCTPTLVDVAVLVGYGVLCLALLIP